MFTYCISAYNFCEISKTTVFKGPMYKVKTCRKYFKQQINKN